TPNISKLQVGVAGQTRTMPFHVAKASVASALTRSAETKMTIEVKVLSLADLIERLAWPQVDLMKIDIEGAEIDMFAACDDELLGRIAQISVEFHDFCGITPAADVERALERFHSIGFSSIRMSRVGHQDTWLINRRLLNISTSELMYTRYVVRNWMGFRRVVEREFSKRTKAFSASKGKRKKFIRLPREINLDGN